MRIQEVGPSWETVAAKVKDLGQMRAENDRLRQGLRNIALMRGAAGRLAKAILDGIDAWKATVNQ